jgi:succinate dehydrogenase / fumarate reductase flavoprotein subunit
MVFGRRSGIYAAKYVKKAKKVRNLTLDHVKKYVRMLKKAGIEPERTAPMLLPDYRGKASLARMIDVF